MAGSGHLCHFVLVHGGSHGAWCWYKLKPALESEGHRVTAVDLAASGVNMSKLEDVKTLRDYSRPVLQVLESVDEDEKIVIVGHSFGGLVTALAMEEFPKKISVGVFVTAFMPDIENPPAHVVSKLFDNMPDGKFLDTEFGTYGEEGRLYNSALLGPKFLETSMYQLSPAEDLELAKMLVRVAPALPSLLAGEKKFTPEGYGSVKRVFIICMEDKTIPKEHQDWMVKNFPVEKVMYMKKADHMPMFSNPEQLYQLLLEASKIGMRFREEQVG